MIKSIIDSIRTNLGYKDYGLPKYDYNYRNHTRYLLTLDTDTLTLVYEDIINELFNRRDYSDDKDLILQYRILRNKLEDRGLIIDNVRSSRNNVDSIN